MRNRTVHALLLAAGLGTRLRPLTDTIPKCLVPIAGRPLLDYWLDALGDAAILRARLNTHAHAEQVRDYIATRNERGCVILEEAHEPKLLGSAGTISANPDLADGADAVAIVYADNLSAVNLEDLLDYHWSHPDPVTMLLFHAEDPASCGIATLDGQSRIVDFVEKPAYPKSDLANAGVYIVDADAYRDMAAESAFDIGFDILPKFVGHMRGLPFEGVHIDVGTPDRYEAAQVQAEQVLGTRGIAEDGTRKAVFLDRDGTLIEQVHYLGKPEKVRLLPGVASAIRSLRRQGYLCVVVTNQAAIGKGVITKRDYLAVNQEMCRQLAHEGAVLDAIYHCPVPGDGPTRHEVTHPDRKPGPGMLTTAARELNLDLIKCWMVGDMISDVLAGYNAGCAGSVLLGSGDDLAGGYEHMPANTPRVEDLASAVAFIKRAAEQIDETLNEKV